MLVDLPSQFTRVSALSSAGRQIQVSGVHIDELGHNSVHGVCLATPHYTVRVLHPQTISVVNVSTMIFREIAALSPRSCVCAPTALINPGKTANSLTHRLVRLCPNRWRLTRPHQS